MRTFVLTAALALLASSPALAYGNGNGQINGVGHINGPANGLGLGHLKHDAPLPLAAGLPALVLMGGAVLLARRARGKE